MLIFLVCCLEDGILVTIVTFLGKTYNVFCFCFLLLLFGRFIGRGIGVMICFFQALSFITKDQVRHSTKVLCLTLALV